MSFHSIGVVERDTGIKRDTLRVWERRYGFPEPVRNQKGERLYPEDQLRQLQRIKRLLGQGCRAGQLLPPDENHLNVMESSLFGVTPSVPDVDAILDAVATADVALVNAIFSRLYAKQGMLNFITQTAMPLVHTVGERWASGKLQIFEEHFISQQLIHFINKEISRLPVNKSKPEVLLVTLPGESHSLGLLMVSAMLSAHNIASINLGAEVPMDQISRAIKKFDIKKLGMTFSGAYQYNHIRDELLEVRSLISDDIDIWIGGAGVKRLRKLPAGVIKVTSLEQLPV